MKLIGSNPKARPYRKTRYLLGLDYIQLTRKDKPTPVAKQHVTDAQKPVVAVKAYSKAGNKNALSKYCFRCHSNDKLEGDVDLAAWADRAQPVAQIELTRRIRNVVRQHHMPPEDELQPPADVRARIVATMDGVVDEYLTQRPAEIPVTMRRMNRYEYNNAVRDLLQLKGDIYPLPEKTIRANQPYFDPASGHFPKAVNVGNRTLGKNQVERQILTGVSPFAIDLQAEGGFNNRGQELSVSPILLESFLTLGRSIVDR